MYTVVLVHLVKYIQLQLCLFLSNKEVNILINDADEPKAQASTSKPFSRLHTDALGSLRLDILIVVISGTAVLAQKPHLMQELPPTLLSGVPRQAERHNLCFVSWVCPEALTHLDTPKTPQLGGFQEAS